ncbi:MAG: carboxypeptidase regulatory-like domain-containing protein, partial [Abditibacteriota bacterium]|nr:carboxypeptidase regulatory-like domain-containing protein [Abditibacteriota bacterium]
SVSGTLIGSDGNPVNGSFTFKIGDTVVDSYNGSFYVNVPNGTYEVTTDYDHIVIEPSTVTVSGVSQQDFRLKDRSTLTGKVIGTDGNPAANFTFNIGDQSVTTDADGNYSAEFLFIGTRDVTVPIFGVEIAPNRVTLSGHGTKDFTLTALTPPDSGHKVVFNAFRGSSDKPAKGVAVKFNGEWKLTDVEGKAVFFLEGLGDFDTTLVPWKTYSVKSVTDVTYDAEPIEANDDGTYTVNVGGPETLIDIDMVGNVLEGYAYDENSAALANFTFRVGNTEVTTDGQGFFRAAVEPGTHKVFALCYVAEPGSVPVEGNTEQDIVFGPVNGHRVIFTAFRGSADKPAKGVAVKFNGEWKLTDADGEAVFFLEGLGDFDINIIPWKTYSVASVTEYGAELTADANGVYVINVSGPETFIGIDIAGNVLEGCAYDENDEVLGNFTFSVGDTEVTTDENGYFKTPIEAGTHEVTAEGSVAEPGEVTVEGVTSQDFRFRVDGDEPEMFNFSGTISNVARAGKVPFSGEYDPETGEYVYEPVLAATNFETGEVFYITPTDVIGATGRHGASGSATCSSLMFDCLLPAGKYKVQFFNGESYDSAYIYRIAKGDTVVTIGDGPVTANYRIQSIRNSIR